VVCQEDDSGPHRTGSNLTHEVCQSCCSYMSLSPGQPTPRMLTRYGVPPLHALAHAGRQAASAVGATLSRLGQETHAPSVRRPDRRCDPQAFRRTTDGLWVSVAGSASVPTSSDALLKESCEYTQAPAATASRSAPFGLRGFVLRDTARPCFNSSDDGCHPREQSRFPTCTWPIRAAPRDTAHRPWHQVDKRESNVLSRR
jgi:hypothetical protein